MNKIWSWGLIIPLMGALSVATVLAEPIGSAFTFQGQLKQNGAPVDQACDLEFALWDDSADSDPSHLLAGPVILTRSVQNGLFTADGIDFGSNHFNGETRWLGIRVSCPPGSGFVEVGRHRLAPTPYALALPALRTEQNPVSPNVIGGYGGVAGVPGNSVEEGVVGATVAGGGSSSAPNQVLANFATVSGGEGNIASGQHATVSGGGLASAPEAYFDCGGEGLECGKCSGGLSDGEICRSSLACTGGICIRDEDSPSCGPGDVCRSFLTVVCIGGPDHLQRCGVCSAGSNAGLICDSDFACPDGVCVPDDANCTSPGVCSSAPNEASGAFATISGGAGNRASENYATVGGGLGNTASGDRSTVGGGDGNVVSRRLSTVGGGSRNTASNDASTISGGLRNIASGSLSTVGGGSGNTASSGVSTVGGGSGNTASGQRSTVGGGVSNTASAHASTVGGGNSNAAEGLFATVPGGRSNTAGGDYDTVGGGRSNIVSGDYGTISGGGESTPGDFATGNRVFDNYGTVGGGGANKAGSDDLGDTASAQFATVGGGWGNTASGRESTVGGGSGNTASGDYSTVSGGGLFEPDDDGFGNTASGNFSTVAGGLRNLASGAGAAVGGGQGNRARELFSTVGGGDTNNAGGDSSSIGGGRSNRANGFGATVSGGIANTASGDRATVGGGTDNIASGLNSTVPGGNLNVADAEFSFAAGQRAQANHSGTFVWADSANAGFASTGPDQFLIQAAGGVGIGKNNPSEQLDVAGNIKISGMLSFDTTGGGVMFPDGSVQNTATIGNLWSENGLDIFYNGGNVGIGTLPSPDAKLEVNGTVRANGIVVSTAGGVQFSDGTVQNTAAIPGDITTDAEGNVGIGVEDPTVKLDVGGAIHATGAVAASAFASNSPWIAEAPEGVERMRINDSNGRVGIGTNDPRAPLHVRGASVAFLPLAQLVIQGSETTGNAGTGGEVWFGGHNGTANATWGMVGARKENSIDGDRRGYLQFKTVVPSTGFFTERMRIDSNGNVGIGTTDPGNERLKVVASSGSAAVWAENSGQGFAGVFRNTNPLGAGAALFVEHQGSGPVIQAFAQGNRVFEVNGNGTTIVDVLQINGADLAEKFPVSQSGVRPGTVMAIDHEHPGKLRVAQGAYNRRVAGVVSGANGLATGAILGNLPESKNAPAIALSGRVWVNCDTSNGKIEPGDLLTTSATPGYAMKVTDYPRAQGAIIGKAMTRLASGNALVLVLVSLQ